MRLQATHPLQVWLAGLEIGLRSVAREPVLGLKRIILPVSYWRSREYAYVWRQLSSPAGARILDLGSPKSLAHMLARHRGYEVVSTDILPEEVELTRRYATAQGLAGEGPGKVRSEVQDGRSLTYPDDSFDAAYSVSVLEHIPGRGYAPARRRCKQRRRSRPGRSGSGRPALLIGPCRDLRRRVPARSRNAA